MFMLMLDVNFMPVREKLEDRMGNGGKVEIGDGLLKDMHGDQGRRYCRLLEPLSFNPWASGPGLTIVWPVGKRRGGDG